MAPRHSSSHSESSDDEDAPETISLAQSKKDIQKIDAELKKAEMAARKSKKSQNREMDRKLKERADMNRGGRQKGDDEVGGLEARMYRAMQEAQEEMDEESESGNVGDSGKDGDDKEEEEDVSSLELEQGSDDDDDEKEEAEILAPDPLKKTYKANHLPDELFTAAFASKASKSKRKTKDIEEDNPPKQTSKKPKRSHTREDLIVGYAFPIYI